MDDAVEREITLPANAETVWELLTDPEELATWLGDDVALDPTPGAAGHIVERDGAPRALVVERVETGRYLSWQWWPDDAPSAAPTRVEITLAPSEAGTVVRVVEHLPSGTGTRAQASAASAWSHRLLHLEALLLVAAAVRG